MAVHERLARPTSAATSRRATKNEALQPDFNGHIWVTTKGGLVLTVDATTRKYLGINTSLALLGERIDNGHAAGQDGGVYIVSTKALYRFDADRFGAPGGHLAKGVYGTGGRLKPGQVDLGSGTTPTLMGTKYVAITDNADPYMHVLVYKCAKQVSGKRLVAKVPVFGAYQASNENSLVCTDRSIVVENNYGYVSPFQDTVGRLHYDAGAGAHRPPARTIHAARSGRTTRLSIPSTVTKLSLANRLVYTYSKPDLADGTSAWYFTAVDFRNGKIGEAARRNRGALRQRLRRHVHRPRRDLLRGRERRHRRDEGPATGL